MIKRLCPNANRIDFVFDTYVNSSVKDSERIRRSGKSAIEVNNLTGDTPLPAEINAFWACSSNKVKLQNFLSGYIIKVA